jgi:cytochrome P450
MPPGPSPILRFLKLIDPTRPADGRMWTLWTTWKDIYGPIFSIPFGVHNTIVVADAKVAKDLMQNKHKRHIYSSRADFPMTKYLQPQSLLVMPTRPEMTAQRSLLALGLRRNTRVLQNLESIQLLHDFLDSKENHQQVFRRCTGSFMLSLTYGKRATTDREPEISHALAVIDYYMGISNWLVNLYPFLDILPKKLAPWHKAARGVYDLEWSGHQRNRATAMASKSWNWAKELNELVRRPEFSGTLSQDDAAYLTGTMFEAGIDTSSIVMEVFMLAAVLHPHFVEKAHKEIDEHIPHDRLPVNDDIDNLPYVKAFVNEVFRWRTITAGGIPHATTEDDIYIRNGRHYHIPKDTIVIPSFWSIHMDADDYGPNPESFDPERWMKASSSHMRHYAFGTGERACPGAPLAKDFINLLMMRMLWAFEFHADPLPDPDAFDANFNSRPLKFDAVVRPRGGWVGVIWRVWEGVDKDIDRCLEEVFKKSKRGGGAMEAEKPIEIME